MKPDETWLIPPSRGAGVMIGLVYPSTYFVGMSSLGYQLIYKILSRQSDIRVERLFYQGPGESPLSVEAGRPAGNFDVLAFSCSFEPDYLNLIRFLLQSNIEPCSSKRSSKAPLLVAGGIAVTSNPAPLSPIIDVFLLGDGEELLTETLEIFSRRMILGKENLHQDLAVIPGVYVPSIHGEFRSESFPPRRILKLDNWPTGSAIITAHTDLADMYLVEAARGCVRGCQFCLTGHFDRRWSIRSADNLLGSVETVRQKIRRVGLIAPEIAKHPEIHQICETLVGWQLEISTSSVEMDWLDRPLMDLLIRGGQKTLTIAPESGDEALRYALGKKISDAQILEMIHQAAEAGFEVLKMYLIIGMPRSTAAEVDALGTFLEKARSAFFGPGGRKRKELVLSVNPFVPKPHTPWEKEPLLEEPEIKRRMLIIRQLAGKLGGIRFTGNSPAFAALDALISHGNAQTGIILMDCITSGVGGIKEVVKRLKENI